MRMRPFFATTLALAMTIVATAADARCTRLAFSVNDYGKDGPIKDAKSLLDKHIATWAAQNGIKKYSTGKKTVSCELYLDLIVFDEHTCKAEASVCWEGGPAAAPAEAGAAPKKAPAAAPKAKAAQAQ